MRIGYNYKIQWLLPVRGNFFKNENTIRRDLFTMIRIVGGRNLTKIYFRDSEENIIRSETYDKMNNHPYDKATDWTINYIKRRLKKNPNIYYVELIRK